MPTEDEKKVTSADYYFDPRARISSHEQGLKDEQGQARMLEFIGGNKEKLNGATVLVVGSGLGLLALQCVRHGGAARVVGVDKSSIVLKANEVARDNKLDDKVTFHQGDIATMDLPIEKGTVDLILCDWIGSLLCNDPVTKQLIAARDLFLKKDGVIAPSKATLYLTSCSDKAYKSDSIGFWDNVYGFKMTAMKKLVFDCPVQSPIPSNQVVTNAAPVHSLDAYTMKEEDCKVAAKNFELRCSRNSEYVHYLLAFVNSEMAHAGWKGYTVKGTPNPRGTTTQTCFCLKEDLAVNSGDIIKGRYEMSDGEPTKIKISLDLAGSAHTTSYTQDFELYNN